MTIQQILFIVLAAVILVSAVLVVTMRNLFHAALFLVISFFGVAGFYVLLDAGFFAATQVLVYIGAISILFIFAVMLTRDVITAQRANSQWIAAAVVVLLLFAGLFVLLSPEKVTFGPVDFTVLGRRILIQQREFGAVQWPLAREGEGLRAVPPTFIGDLGRASVDFNRYAVPFLLAAVMLLVAMVGAIWVAREFRPRDRAELIADEVEPEPLPAPEVVSEQALPENAVAADEH